LNTHDRAALQVDSAIADSVDTTYVSFEASMLHDVAVPGTEIGAVARTAAKQAQFFGDLDETKLVSYELNMDTGILLLKFSLAVDTSSLQTQFITLQSSSSSPATAYTLGEHSGTTSADGFDVSIVLNATDLNAIKQDRLLGTSNLTTYIVIDQKLLSDLSKPPRPIIGVVDTAAMEPLSYTPDVTPPSLQSFDFNLNASGTVTLSFTETVDITTFNASAITIITGQGSGTLFTLTGQTSVVPSDAATEFTLYLTKVDLDELKHIGGLAVNASTTYISFTAGMIMDMAGVSIVPINVTSAKKSG
jgi:hypothetical protein